MRETYELIEHLRKAQDEFFETEGIDGAYWKVDITVGEMSSDLSSVIKKVYDSEYGFEIK